MQRLTVIGWWFNDQAPNGYPLPQRLQSPWDPATRTAVAGYLRAGKTLETYPADSFCRFACADVDMGRRDLTDGRFVWPDGLVHYLEHHDVRLPEDFVAHVLAQRATIAPFVVPKAQFGMFDTGPWLAWAREQGACLDLAGWELPDPDSRARIETELGAIEHDLILLCRGDTREVVLRLADGTLAVHQLRAGGHAPQQLAGWHEWPIDGQTAPTASPGGKPPSVARGRRMASDDVFAALRRKFGGDANP